MIRPNAFLPVLILLLASGTVQAQEVRPPPSPLLGEVPAVAALPPQVMIPDVADQFRAEVSAVVGSGAARRVLLSRNEIYGRASRSLKIGDVYQDGWKVVALSPTAVGLARQGETRLIDLTVADKTAVAVAAAGRENAQRTSVNMGSLGLIVPPPTPPEGAGRVEAADASVGGVDPQALAALVQAMMLLSATLPQ